MILSCILSLFTSLFLSLVVLNPLVAELARHKTWPPSGYGCQKSLPRSQFCGGTINVSINSGGDERSYLIYLPPSYLSAKALPVIVSYHGGNRNASSQLALDQFTSPEYNDFAITVYPQGIDMLWQGVPGVTTNDTQFTNDILDELEDLYCVDRKRIWTSGKSDGAAFCNILACDPVLSTRFAAFAPVSGAFYVDSLLCDADTITVPCSPGRPSIPILEFHGGNDTIIAYNGGLRKNECLPAIPHFVQDWALRDQLGPTNITSHLTEDTLVYRFGSGCEFGLVSSYFDKSIGHDWPSMTPNDDNQTPGHILASYNATPIIMDFFLRYSLPWLS